MKILLSNDDGIDAPGINALAEELREAGHKVVVAAPDRDRSGASNSLSLDSPVRVHQIDGNSWRVSGTPTDCVHIALRGLLDFEPDIVVSGINNSQNLSDDVFYSGTVAAAIEGRSLGLPALAISLVSSGAARHYKSAARAAVEILSRLDTNALSPDVMLNVNVPDVAWSEVKGYEITRLGARNRSQAGVPHEDCRGRHWWWIGPAGPESDAGEGTDFNAVRNGYVSITPIHVDVTAHSSIEKLSTWVSSLTA